MVAKQYIKLGTRHAGKLLTVVIEDTDFRVLHDGEEIAVRPVETLPRPRGSPSPARASSPTDRQGCPENSRSRGHGLGTASTEAARIAELEREVRELRRANQILKSAVFLCGGAGPSIAMKVEFVDSQRKEHGVQPVLRVLEGTPAKFAPST